MVLSWQSLHTYKADTPGLFWINNGVHQYALYGVLARTGAESTRRLRDLNGYVFACEDDIVCWAPCDEPDRPPRPKLSLVSSK